MSRKRLGEMLVDAGLVNEQQLRVALKEQQRWGGSLGRTVVEMKLVGEHDLVRVLAEQLKVAVIDLDAIEIPQSVLAWVTADMADLHAIVPYAQPMKFLDVAMSDPTNLGIIDELRIRTQLNVRTYLSGPRTIERAIAKWYGRGVHGQSHARNASLDFEHDAGRPMEVVRGGTIPPPYATPSGPAAVDLSLPQPARNRDAEIAALQDRLSKLEALVARDEDVLRKVLALLVEKGVATREEIVERLR